MTGGSIEATLELWASSLRDVKARMRPLFTQERVAASAGLFLDGLLGDERRKTGWMRAEAAGDPGPWRQQAILGRGRWDADALRDIVRDYVAREAGRADAVLVIDETGFLKQGKASCGVARQYTGSAGKITNCQIGVFAAYVSRHGHAFIDRALYLPKAWTNDPARLAAAHVPADTSFATKPRARRGDDQPGDRSRRAFRLGRGGQRLRCRRDRDGAASGRKRLCSRGQSRPSLRVVVRQARRCRQRRRDRRRTSTPSAWQRLSAGDGTKGARLHDWAYCELADLEAADYIDQLRRPVDAGPADPPQHHRRRRWRSSRHGARPGRLSKPSSRSRATAGRSRTASRPPRTNSASIITKPAPGMAGIVMCRS